MTRSGAEIRRVLELIQRLRKLLVAPATSPQGRALDAGSRRA
jgi:hypothetical protein